MSKKCLTCPSVVSAEPWQSRGWKRFQPRLLPLALLAAVSSLGVMVLSVQAQAPSPTPAGPQMFGIPGTAPLLPGEAALFAGPGRTPLMVTNAGGAGGGVSATATYDGSVLTVTAPTFYAVQVQADGATCTRVNGLASNIRCVFPLAGQQGSPITFTTQINRGNGPVLYPFTVDYPPGWNLISVTPGTVIDSNIGPLYTLQAGDSVYEAIANGMSLEPGVGYWAYFDRPTEVLSGTAPVVFAPSPYMPVSDPLPAGQFVMIGNPFPITVALSGADAVYTYNPQTRLYTQSAALSAGQGAWAYSASGGSITLTPAPP